jgi:tRNA modification GTPase
MTSQPRAQLLTPPGRGAIAVVYLEAAHEALERILESAFMPAVPTSKMIGRVGGLKYGRWMESCTGEDVVLAFVPNGVEIQCHGGPAPVERILNSLAALGVETSSSEVVESGPLWQRELDHALREAVTWKCAEWLLVQREQAWPRALEDWRQFDPATANDEERSRVQSQLEDSRAFRPFAERLTRPLQIAVVGRPNVGKSSLTNAILGYERVIAHDQPGTTRDLVRSRFALAGWPVEWVDTAGLREAVGEIEREGIVRARQLAESADLILLVFDASIPPMLDDEELLAAFPRAIRVGNKADLPDAWGVKLPGDAVRVSCRTGDGVDRLLDRLAERVATKLPPDETVLAVGPKLAHSLNELETALNQRDSARWRAVVDRLER